MHRIGCIWTTALLYSETICVRVGYTKSYLTCTQRCPPPFDLIAHGLECTLTCTCVALIARNGTGQARSLLHPLFAYCPQLLLTNIFVTATTAAPPTLTSITDIARLLPSRMKRSYRHHAESEQLKRRKISLRDGMLDAAAPSASLLKMSVSSRSASAACLRTKSLKERTRFTPSPPSS